MAQDGLLSSWAEFLLPPFYLGSGYDTFAFAATFKSVAFVHNRAVLLGETKPFQHEHVCQNCRTFVKQNIQ